MRLQTERNAHTKRITMKKDLEKEIAEEEILESKFTHVLSISNLDGTKFKEVMCYSKEEAIRMKLIIYRILFFKLKMTFSYKVIDLAEEKKAIELAKESKIITAASAPSNEIKELRLTMYENSRKQEESYNMLMGMMQKLQDGIKIKRTKRVTA